MLPGETVGMDGMVCEGNGEHGILHLKLQVCQSAAGFYLGYWCPQCGPISRESSYFKTRDAAKLALETREPDRSALYARI